MVKGEKDRDHKLSPTDESRSNSQQSSGFIEKPYSKRQSNLIVKPQLTLPFKLNSLTQENLTSQVGSEPVVSADEWAQPPAQARSKPQVISKLKLKPFVLGTGILTGILMWMVGIVLNAFNILPSYIILIASGMGFLVTVLAALLAVPVVWNTFHNLLQEVQPFRWKIVLTSVIIVALLVTVLLPFKVPSHPQTLVGNLTPTATPNVVHVPTQPPLKPTPIQTQLAGSSPSGGQEPSQSTPISTPISTPPGKSKTPTPLPTWIPVLNRFTPYCDNPTGVEVGWYVHSVGTYYSCNNPSGLTMQQISSGVYGEMDIDEIQGSSYNLPTLRASVQVSFSNSSDTLTSAALIVQTPFQTSAVRTISNGYIFMLNSKGCWKLQYIGNPKTEDTDCVIINPQSVTMTVIVQNDVLTALVNGKPVVPYPVKLHEVPWQVGLVVTSSTALSSQVVFSNFELDKPG